MKKQILFLQGGGGKEDHQADAKMVDSLQSHLRENYAIHFPLLPNEELPDFGRAKQLAQAISAAEDGLILVAHSLGASMLLKYLSENKITKKISGVFLIATPYWNGEEDLKKPLKLKPDFAKHLDPHLPLFFYQAKDDEVVPFAQFEIYKNQLPWATFREIATGGHQLNKGLEEIAHDIHSL